MFQVEREQLLSPVMGRSVVGRVVTGWLLLVGAVVLGLPGGVEAASAPVSYTHLRAHETVLDLVCRLLLEKKKHQNKETIVVESHSTT